MGIQERKPRTRHRATSHPQKREAAPERRGLADALFTTTQQRVLGLLFGQPERSFFATELIILARVGSGAVQRELTRLVASGLVSVSVVGRQKHYRANPESPVFAELRSLVVKTIGLADPVRVALEPLHAQIAVALIYGSVARGEAHAASDLDLLVVSDTLTLEELYRVLGPVESLLGRAIHPTLYTVAEFAQRRSQVDSFLGRVLSGAYQLLIGEVSGGQCPR